MTEVFIGVVSHAGSRFLANTGPDGLAQRLAHRMSSPTTYVAVRVNTENAWSPTVLPITDDLVQASHRAQLDVEARWQAYLEGRTGRRARKALELLARRVRPFDATSGHRGIQRLVNIELSHRALISDGLASGADWILILEDDGASLDPDECARGITALLASTRAHPKPAFVNLSESFTPRQLGIDHLLTPAEGTSWAGAVPRRVLQAERPVTNTVCAIAYRATFAEEVLRRLDAKGLAPVVPIDWKLNDILMDMVHERRLAAGDCWLVDPAPVMQLSMRSTASLPDPAETAS